MQGTAIYEHIRTLIVVLTCSADGSCMAEVEVKSGEVLAKRECGPMICAADACKGHELQH